MQCENFIYFSYGKTLRSCLNITVVMADHSLLTLWKQPVMEREKRHTATTCREWRRVCREEYKKRSKEDLLGRGRLVRGRGSNKNSRTRSKFIKHIILLEDQKNYRGVVPSPPLLPLLPVCYNAKGTWRRTLIPHVL